MWRKGISMRQSYMKALIFAVLFLVGYEFGRVEAIQTEIDTGMEWTVSEGAYAYSEEDCTYGPILLDEVLVEEQFKKEPILNQIQNIEEEREFTVELDPIPTPVESFDIGEIQVPNQIFLT